ncbi:hypothetical protein KSS87_021677 [Heliosperma pusillum]|nr:hypothetical protein KSS87_021677 [Heliosperma pusillum]
MASVATEKVRVVARIKGPLIKDVDNISAAKPWILISRPDPNSSSRVKISFTSDQINSGKQSYEVDECCEQAVGNEEIFTKEIKPLISGLFGGQNSTGFEEEIGLAELTMGSVLAQAEEDRKVVNVSVFEVYQDHIIDLLDSKKSEVSVFEDAQGKIRLKGLSKVKVNSTEEFQRLYQNAANTRTQKATEPTHRSHIGCILYLVSPQTENLSAKLVGKINFIDLASYEDSRRKSNDSSKLAETTSIKKSLTAVHNVLYALNANDRVPYRESKLTRMLQDSLGGSSKILMITCMNPVFCQETVQTISVASRSCIAGFLAYLNPKSGRSTNKTIGMPSPRTVKSASRPSSRINLMSPKVMKPISASASVRKHTESRVQMSVRKASDSVAVQKSGRKLFADINQDKTAKITSASASARKHTESRVQMSVRKAGGSVAVQKSGRKLFADNKKDKIAKQKNVCPVAVPSTDSSGQLEVLSSLDREEAADLLTQPEKSTVTVFPDVASSQLPSDKEMSKSSSQANSSEPLLEKDAIQVENKVTAPDVCKTPTAGRYLVEDKENKFHEGPSPTLSAGLQELSNNLKSLSISTEANFKTPKHEISNNGSPWTTLHAMKGIGEKRAEYIVELRDESVEPFKELDDLKDIGLSEKQITGLMKNIAGNLFT